MYVWAGGSRPARVLDLANKGASRRPSVCSAVRLIACLSVVYVSCAGAIAISVTDTHALVLTRTPVLLFVAGAGAAAAAAVCCSLSPHALKTHPLRLACSAHSSAYELHLSEEGGAVGVAVRHVNLSAEAPMSQIVDVCATGDMCYAMTGKHALFSCICFICRALCACVCVFVAASPSLMPVLLTQTTAPCSAGTSVRPSFRHISAMLAMRRCVFVRSCTRITFRCLLRVFTHISDISATFADWQDTGERTEELPWPGEADVAESVSEHAELSAKMQRIGRLREGDYPLPYLTNTDDEVRQTETACAIRSCLLTWISLLRSFLLCSCSCYRWSSFATSCRS